jgi:leucyl aminopeptidase
LATKITSKPDFDPTPSLAAYTNVDLAVAESAPTSATAVGILVGPTGAVAKELGADRAGLTAAGFDGAEGQALALPQAGGKVAIAVGCGDAGKLGAAGLRDAAAAFARAAGKHSDLAVALPAGRGLGAAAAAQAIVEGVLLARYSYQALRSKPGASEISRITLVAPKALAKEAAAGAERGRLFASATRLARDLANTPHNHLTATKLAEVAVRLGKATGLGVEIFDKEALIKMGCGGLLGVNAGSAEPPQMIKLTYTPKGKASGRLSLVGKGIMYDAGGIALKPGDEVHAQMKNDMSGAAAIFAAMLAMTQLDCPAAVTGYLMCTDNMPSGTAMALGDVITIRGGKTVEVINSDAEGRLVMADALVLSTEERYDAIVDIATLTGACMRALGSRIAGVMGNDDGLVEQVRAAAAATDEPVWPFPLEPSYRAELNSNIADIKNLGGALAGQITAGLFLQEFVGDIPWAHIDIAGTAWVGADSSWRTAGCSGFGARLLLQLALDFAPAARRSG